MERLTKGTKEYLVIPVTDTLSNLNAENVLLLGDGNALTVEIGGLQSATYDIYFANAEDGDEAIIENAPAIISGMKILPLIDTADMDEGVYSLFVKFDALPEVPRLGPFQFRVDD